MLWNRNELMEGVSPWSWSIMTVLSRLPSSLRKFTPLQWEDYGTDINLGKLRNPLPADQASMNAIGITANLGVEARRL
eukprot:COSAG02_NODE_5427_length_4339_cov_2.935377_2_plen_78_part_00